MSQMIVAFMKQPCVYIVTNKNNGTLYTGVTADLLQRITSHKIGLTQGFTKKYGCTMLIYFEEHSSMEGAIAREKQIKAFVRKKKLNLINKFNPEWRDLYEKLG